MVLSERADKATHLDYLLWVETDRRLVKNDNGRISDKRLGNSHSLSVSLRKIFYQPFTNVTDLNDLADLGNMRFSVKFTALKLIIEFKIFINRLS